MAAPTAPTLTSLTTEGLKRAGISNPSSTYLTRAADWMEDIKNDILVFSGGRKLKDLYVTSIITLTEGQNRYSNPTDYFSDMTVELLYGVHQDTAQAGAVGSITLAADEDVDSTGIIGKDIVIVSGTGVNSISQCVTYSSTTKVATVSPNFTTAPDVGSGYMIVDTVYNLKPEPVWNLSKITMQNEQGRPYVYYPIGDEDYGEFILRPTPYTTDSKVYAARMRYYANLMTMDLAGTTIATLYQNWRNLWIQGVKARSLEDRKQVTAPQEMGLYYRMIEQLIAYKTYGTDIANLQMTVER